MRKYLPLLLLLLFCNTGFSQPMYEVETDNLDIFYFSPSMTVFMPRVIRSHNTAQVLHNQLWNHWNDSLPNIFKYNPQKTTIIFTDWEDDGNAGVNAIPKNTIYIGISPMNKSYFVSPSIELFTNLFRHEQAHVVMSDKFTKSDLHWRKFLGGKINRDAHYPISAIWSFASTPRWYAPRWYHEGIACFLETWLCGGMGRAMGGYDEMYFRSIVAENKSLYSVVGLETEGTTQDFQVGTNSYLYGTRFVNYLAMQYGTDSLFAFYNRTPDSKLLFYKQFKRIYGKPLKSVWNDWRDFEAQWQQKNLETIREYPETPVLPLADHPMGSASPPIYDKEKNVIYTAVNYPGKFAHVCEINLATGKERKIAKIESPMLYQTAYIAFDKNHNRLFVTTFNQKMRGLHIIDLNNNRTIKKVDYTRTRDIVYNPINDKLYGIQVNQGVAMLVCFDDDFKTTKQLYSIPFGQTLSDLAVSHDGKKLSATLHGVHGDQQLIEFDINGLEMADLSYQVIMSIDQSNLGQFSYSDNDSLMFGSSYYTGVSNIWSINRFTKEMKLLSNTDLGLFAPVQCSKDSLIALQYGRNGLTPVKMGIHPIEDANAIEYLGQAVYDRDSTIVNLHTIKNPDSEDFIENFEIKEKKYSSFKSMKFNGAYPDITGYKQTVTVGYRLFFQDKLGINSLMMYLGISPWSHYKNSEKIHFNLKWNYQWLTLDAYFNNSSFYDLVGPLKVGRAGYKIGLNYDRPYTLKAPFEWKWGVGISTYGMMDALPLFQNIESPVSEMQTATAYIEASKMRKTLGAVMPESGYKINLSGYTYFADNTFFPSVSLQFDKGFLMPLVRNTSFWIRTAFGQSFGNEESAFGNDYFGGFRNNYIDYHSEYQYREINAMPGADIDEIAAHSFAKATAELNLKPLRFKSFGFTALYPTFAQLSLFATDLVTNPWTSKYPENYINVGAQLNIEVILFSYLKTTWSVGYAQLFPQNAPSKGQWMFSVKLL